MTKQAGYLYYELPVLLDYWTIVQMELCEPVTHSGQISYQRSFKISCKGPRKHIESSEKEQKSCKTAKKKKTLQKVPKHCTKEKTILNP